MIFSMLIPSESRRAAGRGLEATLIIIGVVDERKDFKDIFKEYVERVRPGLSRVARWIVKL